MKPVRVHLSRKKGWRKPADTLVVARPSRYGNPYRIGDPGVPDRRTAVALFRAAVTGDQRLLAADAVWSAFQTSLVREHLAGKNLACWCPLHEPCHADVLLEIANS